ncbi:hypothetical protein PanWU01x14_016220, partial [Parasponia andersonii]
GWFRWWLLRPATARRFWVMASINDGMLDDCNGWPWVKKLGDLEEKEGKCRDLWAISKTVTLRVNF